jgi:hypothetical protein
MRLFFINGDKWGKDVFPYLEIDDTAQIEHDTNLLQSRSEEPNLYYCTQRDWNKRTSSTYCDRYCTCLMN